MAKKIKSIVFIFGLIAMAMLANFAFAQDFGTTQVNSAISLGQSDPRVIIGRIIQIALSFLGVIALSLIIYAGFLWTTSAGDEEKITRAKKILRDAIIGLVIILSSWAITTFVLAKLNGAINNGSGIVDTGNNSAFANSGMGAIGACSVDSFYPENGQSDVSRNTSIIITFKEEVKINTVCVNAAGQSCACDGGACNKINPLAFRIYKTDLGDACASGSCPNTNANITDVNVAVSSNNKTLVLTPVAYLGDGTSNISYSVKISSDLQKKSDGSSIFKDCGASYFNWKFEVGTRLDLTPPQVAYGNIFPLPDNENDIQNISTPAKAAQALVTVANCPNIYKAAAVTSIASVGTSPAASAVSLNYRGEITKFKVVIAADSKDKAQLFDGNNINNLLGAADFDAQGNARFPGYFVLTAPDRNPGSAWDIVLSPERLADTLTIGAQTYTFSSAVAGNNNIYVDPNSCNPTNQASQIYAVLSGDPLVNVTRNGNAITLTAKVAGADGNRAVIATTNPVALQTQTFKGGSDKVDLAQVKDKKDVPMNTVIQINFNKSVNPLKVAGLASEVKDYIKVVNYNASSTANGSSCANDSDCRSYKCAGDSGSKVCVGDYVDGKFLVSNAYKTVEFVSNNECGINGCGEKIYCLPASSHLAVEMKAADLKTCTANSDCLAYAPYKTCSSTPLGYNTCQNIDGENYPTATSTLNGIIDTSLNSFDGDRNVVSDGPISYYNDNFNTTVNKNKKDNYRWSFYVNDKIMLTPPEIDSVSPAQGLTGVNLADPIRISWNTLMMNSSLLTGSRQIISGTSTIEHKMINLKSSTPSALGYWIENDNIDTEPLDGEPDKTITWIKHSPLSEAMTYQALAGSGVRDIYQNCYKPSAGVKCPVTAGAPSCCFGAATSTLGADGTCK